MVTLRPEGSRPRQHNLVRLVANGLIVCGLLLSAGVGLLYAYQVIESGRAALESRQRLDAFARQLQETELNQEIEQQRAAPEQERPTETPSLMEAETRVVSPTVTPSVVPTAVPTPLPEMMRARRILIPAIDVDSEVVEAEIKNGEWNVPKFVVGHLQGTSDPGRKGNAVYSGHIQSIASGNVFARLGELKLGDLVELQSQNGKYSYDVQGMKVVANTDLSVIADSDVPTVTLITCTGTWDFVQRDYLERLVIVARLR